MRTIFVHIIFIEEFVIWRWQGAGLDIFRYCTNWL